ncbi:aldehyde-activating protein [Thioalkalivibrio denitrificans]|uniref:Aldehyde-activating protein n=1 Tax=Thioalkalivibrio denitrificans TaxID=108003 RepID=A0A1V3NJN4_9GAMM|nr:GFA family protein [Thioalkalivibrio denitrificans]OOG25153.1 aldehyde-activating protein [Thioalkalivibrio denitrificans]
MTEYHGSCHCGKVRFSFESAPIEKGIRCNCSICARKGALMSPDPLPEEALKIEAPDDALVLYQFGARTAKHFFCRHCGIYPFHETARKAGHYRVNLGCVDGVDTFALPFDVFDGKHLL